MIKQYIDNAHTIGVISHINPDADNLGSLTALSTSLRLYGKNVISIAVDTIPYNLEFLFGIDKITDNWNTEIDLLFILDCSSVDRLGSAIGILNNANTLVNIDHHISNTIDADFSIVNVTASSTGEVLYDFLREMNLPINNHVADSLLTAISGDSGSFKYDTVTTKTFDIASDLMKLGANHKLVNTNLYSMNRMSKVKILGKAISRLKIIPEKKLGYTYILNQDFEELNAADADIEGAVEYIRDIEDIEIAILFRENKSGFKASTRSKEEYDVSKLALKFGGGGHIRAAGFTVSNHDLELVVTEVIEAL